ncbi:hypothetical protein KKI23_04175, partial [Patescibacteria group bacterium]|nr:hypothetical protein [Patescibacteria group bacterium]
GVSSCEDNGGIKGAGSNYCYNGAATTAVVWALLPSDGTKSVCWDADSGVLKDTGGIPAPAATACP